MAKFFDKPRQSSKISYPDKISANQLTEIPYRTVDYEIIPSDSKNHYYIDTKDIIGTSGDGWDINKAYALNYDEQNGRYFIERDKPLVAKRVSGINDYKHGGNKILEFPRYEDDNCVYYFTPYYEGVDLCYYEDAKDFYINIVETIKKAAEYGDSIPCDPVNTHTIKAFRKRKYDLKALNSRICQFPQFEKMDYIDKINAVMDMGKTLYELKLKDRIDGILQLCNQLFVMHCVKNMAHLDLKPENIICDYKRGTLYINITDFDYAIHLEDGENSECTKNKAFGTIECQAPEVLLIPFSGCKNEDLQVTRKADIYSIVAVFISLLGGVDVYEYRKKIDQRNLRNPRNLPNLKSGFKIEDLTCEWKEEYFKTDEGKETLAIIGDAAKNFLNKMQNNEPKNRPNILVCICFFQKLYDCVLLIENSQNEQQEDEISALCKNLETLSEMQQDSLDRLCSATWLAQLTLQTLITKIKYHNDANVATRRKDGKPARNIKELQNVMSNNKEILNNPAPITYRNIDEMLKFVRAIKSTNDKDVTHPMTKAAAECIEKLKTLQEMYNKFDLMPQQEQKTSLSCKL